MARTAFKWTVCWIVASLLLFAVMFAINCFAGWHIPDPTGQLSGMPLSRFMAAFFGALFATGHIAQERLA